MGYPYRIPKYDLLTPTEVERIQGASLLILSETGVKVPSSRMIELAAAHGAEVNRGKQIIRFTADIVLEAVSSAGKQHVLYGRNRSKTAEFGCGMFNFNGSSGQFQICDAPGTNRRKPTLEDRSHHGHEDGNDLLRFSRASLDGSRLDPVRQILRLSGIQQHGIERFESPGCPIRNRKRGHSGFGSAGPVGYLRAPGYLWRRQRRRTSRAQEERTLVQGTGDFDRHKTRIGARQTSGELWYRFSQ